MAHSPISFNDRFQVNNQQAPVRKLNFAYTFRPIYLVSRVFGLMPFSIVYYPNGDIHKPRISKFDGVWSVLSLSIYVYGIFSTLSYTNEYSANLRFQSKILNICYTLTIGLGLGFCISSIILDMGNRFKLIGIIKKFDIFDKEASKIEFFF